MTPKMFANLCRAGDLAEIKKADLSVMRAAANKGLGQSITGNKIEVARFLVKKFSAKRERKHLDLAFDDNFPIRMAATYGTLEMLRFIVEEAVGALEQPIDMTAKDNYALRGVAGKGQLEKVRYLVETAPDFLGQTVDLSANNYSSLRDSGAKGYIEVFQYLMEEAPRFTGQKIEVEGWIDDVLQKAAENDHPKVVAYIEGLLADREEAGAEPPEESVVEPTEELAVEEKPETAAPVDIDKLVGDEIVEGPTEAIVSLSLRICAPSWFRDPEFAKWIIAKSAKGEIATWHGHKKKVHEYSDVFVTVDPALNGEGSEKADMPEHIWDNIIEFCRQRFAPGEREPIVVVISPV